MNAKLFAPILILLLAVVPCRATSYLITPEGDGDYPTIQEAVDAAASGDTINLADGTFVLRDEYGISVFQKELLIRSLSGDPELCVIKARGWNFGRGVHFSSAGGREGGLEGVTVTDGRMGAGGGILIRESSPSIRNCIIKNNIATSDGGAGIWIGYDSHPLIENCHIYANVTYALGSGAGIQINSGSIEIYGCVIENNFAGQSTSSIGAGGLNLNSPATLRDCIIRGNTTLGYGGGLNCDRATTIENCLIVDNTAGLGGGGIYFESGNISADSLVIRDCTIAGNDAPVGAGIWHRRSNVVTPPDVLFVERSIIAHNLTSQAIKCDNAADPVAASCSDIFGNEGGDWIHCLYNQDGVNGNFSADPLFCDPSAGNYTLDAASPCLPEHNGCATQIGPYGEGCVLTSAPAASAQPLPVVRSFPNPFNPETEIVFALLSAEVVTIKVFDSAGRVVRELLRDERYPAGRHSVHWEGRDDRGKALPSGIYHCRVAIGDTVSSTKLTLLK